MDGVSRRRHLANNARHGTAMEGMFSSGFGCLMTARRCVAQPTKEREFNAQSVPNPCPVDLGDHPAGVFAVRLR